MDGIEICLISDYRTILNPYICSIGLQLGFVLSNIENTLPKLIFETLIFALIYFFIYLFIFITATFKKKNLCVKSSNSD